MFHIKFAVTIWECYTFGEDPWVGLNGSQILKKIDREGERLHHPDACPPDVYQLMLQCWDKTPTERPTFAAIKYVFNFNMHIILLYHLFSLSFSSIYFYKIENFSSDRRHNL